MSAFHCILTIVAGGLAFSEAFLGLKRGWALVAWIAVAMFAHYRLMRYIKKFGYIKYD
jgi:hypothetical protein